MHAVGVASRGREVTAEAGLRRLRLVGCELQRCGSIGWTHLVVFVAGHAVQEVVGRGPQLARVRVHGEPSSVGEAGPEEAIAVAGQAVGVVDRGIRAGLLVSSRGGGSLLNCPVRAAALGQPGAERQRQYYEACSQYRNPGHRTGPWPVVRP